jgi:hypothetical protein
MGGKHHHHHGGHHRRGRFRGGRGFGVDVIEVVPEYVDNECWIERFPDGTFRKRCPPVEALGYDDASGPIGYLRYSEGAGDILPTLVSSDTAKAYLAETNTQYETLDKAITSSATPLPADFLTSWNGTLLGWKAFFNTATATVGFFTAKAVMDQTDRWVQILSQFSAQFHQLSPSSPVPTTPAPPGQGVGGQTDLGSLLKGSTGLVIAGAALAAILVFGPRLSKG